MFIGDVEKSDIISVKSYLGTLLLGILPVIGDILLIKWSKDNEVRENKRNLCKAFMCIKLAIIYPSLVILLVILALLV